MKALLLAAVVAVILAACAGASVVYTIPLPAGPSLSEFFTAGAGNNYWTVGTGGQLFGVNLTAKKLQTTKDLRGTSISGLIGMGNGGVIVQLVDGVLLAFDNWGNFLWTSNAITLSTRANAYTIIGTTAYIASDAMQQFFTVDLTTGQIFGTPIDIVGGNVYPNMVVLTIAGSTGNVLTAYSLPAMQPLFSLSNVENYLTMSTDIILVTNTSASGETQVLVYDRSSLNLINTLHAMEGVYRDGFTPVVKGRFGLFLLGVEVVRMAYIDLLSGIIHYEIYVGNTATGGAFIGDTAYATISNLQLTVINLQTGTQTLSVNNVPYSPAQTIVNIGGGVIAVVNLQGYTSWNVNTGALVARDETLPGFNPAANYMWNSYTVYTQGAAVIVATSN